MRIVLGRKIIVLWLVNTILIIISMFIPGSTIMAIVFSLWLDGIIYTLENLDKRGALFGFLISFFLLLIGREFLERFGLHDIETTFSSELNIHAEMLLLLSLVTLFLGYYISGKVTITHIRRNNFNRNDYNSRKYFAIQEVSRVLFYSTFAFNLFTLLDIVLFVARHGYILFYTSYVSSIPYAVKKIGDMCLVCFWIFLATMPPKQRVNKLSIFYILYLLLTLGTGKRFPFVAGLLTLFIYYVARNKINNDGTPWIQKKTIVKFAILAPIMIWLLYIIGKIRVDRIIDSLRLDKALAEFFYDQGVTINVIKRAEMYSSMLPDKAFLFGSTYEAISNNVIFRLLGAPRYSGNTVQHALEGYSFQHALSYTTMGNYYLSGHGLGSCYIAEAYHDLGYIGVIIVNFIYGIIFRKVFDFKRHGVWGTAIIISMLYSLLLAPRGSADGFITDIVDLTTWGTIVVVWISSKLLLNKEESVYKKKDW